MISRRARIRNEIKKNKPYHLAHTEARFLLKILHISRVFALS